jgi:hypothetical protein
MKIYYKSGSQSARHLPVKLRGQNALILKHNNWYYFGRKTTLGAALFFEGNHFEFEFEFHIKMLIEEYDYTSQKLDDLRNDGSPSKSPGTVTPKRQPGDEYLPLV